MIYIFIEIIILLSVNVNEYVYPGLKNGNHAKYAGLYGQTQYILNGIVGVRNMHKSCSSSNRDCFDSSL